MFSFQQMVIVSGDTVPRISGVSSWHNSCSTAVTRNGLRTPGVGSCKLWSQRFVILLDDVITTNLSQLSFLTVARVFFEILVKCIDCTHGLTVLFSCPLLGSFDLPANFSFPMRLFVLR